MLNIQCISVLDFMKYIAYLAFSGRLNALFELNAKYAVYFMKSSGFHEIWWISPSTPLQNIQCISVFELNAKYVVCFMKSGRFHEIWQISPSTPLLND